MQRVGTVNTIIVIDLYDTDFHEWAETQAGLLRKRSANALDWDNLAEEIEALARNDRREIRASRSTVPTFAEVAVPAVTVLGKLARLDYGSAQPHRGRGGGREGALAETGVADLPAACPWTAEQVLDHDFWPDA